MPDPLGGKRPHQHWLLPEHSTVRSLSFPPHPSSRETEAQAEGRRTHCKLLPLQPLSGSLPLETPFPPAPRAEHTPGSTLRPAERTAGPELLQSPRLGGGCTAPHPHPCRLQCRQAQSRGQLTLTPLPLASALLGFKYKYIQIIINIYIVIFMYIQNHRGFAVGFPQHAIPWHACGHPPRPRNHWEKGFLAQKSLLCILSLQSLGGALFSQGFLAGLSKDAGCNSHVGMCVLLPMGVQLPQGGVADPLALHANLSSQQYLSGPQLPV